MITQTGMKLAQATATSKEVMILATPANATATKLTLKLKMNGTTPNAVAMVSLMMPMLPTALTQMRILKEELINK
jgi:hypothetical protein